MGIWFKDWRIRVDLFRQWNPGDLVWRIFLSSLDRHRHCLTKVCTVRMSN
jgi:hypothetical protein